ncbi:hypothetical protein [Armatimonas sp.]|uniref:hypothetical protein n=1 Tax=Armatimonas sp. TaxID=1872638 RepID=UPI00375157F3
MRLKTVVAQESAVRYTVPLTATSTPLRIPISIEETCQPSTLKKVTPPLVHPKRLAVISGVFLLSIGTLHLLTVNELPVFPKPPSALLHRPLSRGASDYLTAAKSLTSSDVYQGTWTLQLHRQLVKDNQLPLTLIHKAAQQKQSNEFHLRSDVTQLLKAEFVVARADSKRAQAVAALTDFVRLHSLNARSATDTIFIHPRVLSWLGEALKQGKFSVAESAPLREALSDALTVEPNWRGFAASAKYRAAVNELPTLLEGRPISAYESRYTANPDKLNWDNLVNGRKLGQALSQAQRQGAILRYGSQGIVDSGTAYLDALEKQVLGEQVTLPPLPQIPGAEFLGGELKQIPETRKLFGECQKYLQELLQSLGVQMYQGRTLLSGMIGGLCEGIAMAPAERTVAHLTAAQARAAATRLESLMAKRTTLEQVLADELATTQEQLRYYADPRAQEQFWGRIPIVRITNEAMIQRYQQVMEQFRTEATQPFQKFRQGSDFSANPYDPLMILAAQNVPNVIRASTTYTWRTVLARRLLLKLTLHAWQKEHHGVFPQNLSELVTQGYLKALPADAFSTSGHDDFRYDPATSKVWSVGWDGTDQHGVGDDTVTTLFGA